MLTSKILGLRPTASNLARIDRLASALTRQTGVEVRRGGVAMSALLSGLDALERQHGLGDHGEAPPIVVHTTTGHGFTEGDRIGAPKAKHGAKGSGS